MLMRAGLNEAEIAYKTAETNDLDKPENSDLLSPACRVHGIITKAALAEGWDCHFAYVLCSLAATGGEGAMTQLAGRILRQPRAMKTGVAALDECYVYSHRADTSRVVAAIKEGLTRDGLSDLLRDIVLPGGAAVASPKRAIPRRDTLRRSDIAPPQVLWIEPGQAPRRIHPEADLHADIDWGGCDLTAFADASPENAQTTESQIVRVSTAERAGFETETRGRQIIARLVDPAFTVRMLGELIPKPVRRAHSRWTSPGAADRAGVRRRTNRASLPLHHRRTATPSRSLARRTIRLRLQGTPGGGPDRTSPAR